jgi:hypothetical protein
MVITVRNGIGRLVAVAPFKIRRAQFGKWGLSALSFLMAHDVVGSYHLNLLVDPEYETLSVDAIASVIEQHRPEWDYIELFPSDESSASLKRLCAQLRSAGMIEKIVETQEFACLWADLPSSFEEYLKGVGPNVRYNFRRRWRALEREGVEFVVYRGKEEILGQIDELFRLHRLRFAEKRLTSDLLKPGVYQFHLDAAAKLAQNFMACLFLLKVRGQAIAALYGFSAGKRFSFYQAGMDPAWSRLSVGLVMMGCSIKEAIRSGHDEYDFFGAGNPYKLQWANHARANVMICFFDRRIRSQYAWSRICLIEQLRKLKQRYSHGNSSDHERDESLQPRQMS